MAAKKKKGGGHGGKTVAKNKEATRRWDVIEKWEAGLELLGTEVKAMREGKVQIGDAYCQLEGTELFLRNMHVGAYAPAGPFGQHNPTRPRKLLLNGAEIERLLGQIRERGLSVVPLEIYFKNGWAKASVALCKGKRQADRREDLKKKDAQREIDRAMRRR